MATSQLRVGDALRSHDGQWLAVEDVRDTGREEVVYNGRVAEYHTYFVGDEGWGFSVWAHNSCGPGGGEASNGGVLNTARYAQTSFSSTFSMEGTRIYSRLAGRPINTIDDMVAAIRAGHINPSQIEVNYIVRPGGRTLILNTRTGQALEQAGIPRSQWNAINRTGHPDFERMLSEQLRRNNLTNSGIANPVWNGR